MAELKLPHVADYQNPLEYAQAITEAYAEYRQECIRQIDWAQAPAIRTERPKPRAIDTAHDFLSQHPYMRERYLKIGALAFLEND